MLLPITSPNRKPAALDRHDGLDLVSTTMSLPQEQTYGYYHSSCAHVQPRP